MNTATSGLTVYSVLVSRPSDTYPLSVAILAATPLSARKLALASYRRRFDVAPSVPVYTAIDLRGAA